MAEGNETEEIALIIHLFYNSHSLAAHSVHPGITLYLLWLAILSLI